MVLEKEIPYHGLTDYELHYCWCCGVRQPTFKKFGVKWHEEEWNRYTNLCGNCDFENKRNFRPDNYCHAIDREINIKEFCYNEKLERHCQSFYSSYPRRCKNCGIYEKTLLEREKQNYVRT